MVWRWFGDGLEMVWRWVGDGLGWKKSKTFAWDITQNARFSTVRIRALNRSIYLTLVRIQTPRETDLATSTTDSTSQNYNIKCYIHRTKKPPSGDLASNIKSLFGALVRFCNIKIQHYGSRLKKVHWTFHSFVVGFQVLSGSFLPERSQKTEWSDPLGLCNIFWDSSC